MKKARIALMGGLGYPATESPWGMPQLKTRLEAIGVEVFLTSWKDRQGVFNFLNGFDGFRGMIGDSLGAGSAGQYPGDLKGVVDFAAGFQPSEYDARTVRDQSGKYVQIIASNIVRAHCVYDSYWIDTVGLGYAQWVTAHGSATKLLVTDHRGAHPDDFGYSQDLVFSEVKGLIE